MLEQHPACEREDPAARALRTGLGQIPVPEVSAAFDERVLAALRREATVPPRLARWLSWRMLRPVLAGATCSLALTVALYRWSLSLPPGTGASHVAGPSENVALDQALERADSAVTLAQFATLTRAALRLGTAPRAPVNLAPGSRS